MWLFPIAFTALFFAGKKQKLKKETKKISTKIKNFRFKKGIVSFLISFKNSSDKEIKIDEIKVDFISNNKVILSKKEKDIVIPSKGNKEIKINADLMKVLSSLKNLSMKITYISGQSRISRTKKLL